MLGMKTYSQEYVDACRAKIDLDVAAFANVRSGLKGDAGEIVEIAYFNNMLLVLDYLFVHRLAGVDGKDGNPLNELRVMCDSILSNEGVMTSGTVSKSSQMRFNKAIKLAPERSVLKYDVGDRIGVHQQEFIRLFDAVFAELESKYLS
jgi:hypothetical protein